MGDIPEIPLEVARKLGHYVYLYVNPLDGIVFYVGKGRGKRALAHLDNKVKTDIADVIREIEAAGAEPQIEILAHGLPSAQSAFQIEAAVIDIIGLHNLTNSVRGRGAKFGRMPLDELAAHYTHRKANIKEPGILIRINTHYRYGMSDAELYDVTRCAWKVGRRRREQAKFAFAVFEGVIREVYSITQWLPGGSTYHVRRKGRAATFKKGRWEFVGTIAEPATRDRYINRYVGHLFTHGNQNPISYINIE